MGTFYPGIFDSNWWFLRIWSPVLEGVNCRLQVIVSSELKQPKPLLMRTLGIKILCLSLKLAFLILMRNCDRGNILSSNI